MKKQLLASLLIFLFVAACGGSGPDGQAGAEDELIAENQLDEFDDIDLLAYPADLAPLPEANPLNLEISLEEGNTVTDIINHDEGGTLSVIAQDGTIYTLLIPSGALLSPAEISMTPLDQVANLPIDDAITSGILLEPDGLVFVKPATLSIQFPDSAELDIVLGFGTFADGEDFHFKPSELTGRILTLEVNHFSTMGGIQVGGGRGDDQDPGDSNTIGLDVLREANKHFVPFHGEARFDNQLSDSFGESSSDAEFADLYENALKQWFHSSVKVGLNQAGADSQIIDQALANAKRWSDWVGTPPEPLTREEYRSRFDAEYDLMWNLMAKAFKNGFDDAERKCRDNVDGPDEAVRMMRWRGMIEHISDRSDPVRRDLLYGKEGLEESKVREQIDNCLAFEVEFRSRAELKFGTRGTFVIQYHMEKIELEYNLTSNEMSVEKPIKIETINFDPGTASVSCPASAQAGRVKIEIIASANFSYNSQRLVAMWLEILFNQKPIESFSCAGQAPTSGSFWQAALDDAYHLVGTTQAIASLPMRIVRLPEVYARFTETKATETFSGTLLTTVEIIHTPIE